MFPCRGHLKDVFNVLCLLWESLVKLDLWPESSSRRWVSSAAAMMSHPEITSQVRAALERGPNLVRWPQHTPIYTVLRVFLRFLFLPGSYSRQNQTALGRISECCSLVKLKIYHEVSISEGNVRGQRSQLILLIVLNTVNWTCIVTVGSSPPFIPLPPPFSPHSFSLPVFPHPLSRSFLCPPLSSLPPPPLPVSLVFQWILQRRY